MQNARKEKGLSQGFVMLLKFNAAEGTETNGVHRLQIQVFRELYLSMPL